MMTANDAREDFESEVCTRCGGTGTYRSPLRKKASERGAIKYSVKRRANMFDPITAFKKLEGSQFTPGDFRNALKRMRGEHVENLPAEFEVDDLYRLASARGWLREIKGKIVVKVASNDRGARAVRG